MMRPGPEARRAIVLVAISCLGLAPAARATAAASPLGDRSVRRRGTEFSIPTADARPVGVAAGPDRAVWFTEADGNAIGRVAPSGEIHEFSIPTPASDPIEIAAGPDGAMWFTENAANQVGRITTDGVVSEFPLGFPADLATGPDGN